MTVGQLWLFDPPKPLVERLGEDFFSGLPAKPGVYLMCGEAEGVLYVGKARNLRKRLASYRVVNPERLPRRTIRLLHQVRRIEWDECPTEQAASEREELLICVLAPKFNAAGKVREVKRWLGSPAEMLAWTGTWRGKSKTRLVAAAEAFIMKTSKELPIANRAMK
jgi:hypothetical protein